MNSTNKQSTTSHEHSNRRQLLRLLSYYRAHTKLIAIAFLGLCLFSTIDAGMIYFIKPLIDNGLSNANSDTLKIGAILVVLIFLFRGIASFISNYTIAYMSSKITYCIRQQTFEKLLVLPRSFYESHSRGSIISKLIYDTEQISHAISKSGVIIVRESIIILVLIGMMIYNSWQLSAIFLIIGPVITLLINRVAKRFKRISSQLQVSMGEVSCATEQAIVNQQEILLLNTATQICTQFAKVNNKNRLQHCKLAATSAQNNPIIQLIASFAIAGVLLLASIEQVLNSLTPGTFTLVLVAMASLLKPLKQLTNVNQQLQKGLAAAQSLFTLLDEPVEQDNGTLTLRGEQFTIRFNQLSFTYPNNLYNTAKNAETRTESKVKAAINNLSCTIAAGKSIAIVGESGSGKSTLTSLLLRLYQAPKQSIFINNIAIEEYTLSSLRAHCVLVSQNIVLIDDTLENNIRFGCHHAITDEDIKMAAEKANVLTFADNMPLGLATPVGENGRNLSGGQRQRIAIARAILRDSPIIILDEATSALDNTAEKFVKQALAQLGKNKTMIIIAHRLSSISEVDDILVMHQGRLVEQGSHHALLLKKGHYYNLYHDDASPELIS
ncbi:ATP-binding cassette domain-containing protein [Colwellia sp. D2M02]|uniref:ABC transporter transmembrane domain-containing protein n=1 Tax=Colwellia sp. D2M02 TaxID=2841562 RepID=UPI001C0A099D|nr:ABC transporter transmembrane domain-containing protein [Colwellia sp. D2M02]MBU2892536.1 ATP-binding cassette domain-containing protein [Colwellia sp. D2M02]